MVICERSGTVESIAEHARVLSESQIDELGVFFGFAEQYAHPHADREGERGRISYLLWIL